MAYPRFRLSRAHKKVSSTSGPYTVAVDAWVDIDSAGGLDITLPARVGDDIELVASFVWSNEAAAGSFTVATRVAGAVVNRAGGTYGIASGYTDPSRAQAVTPHTIYTVQAADIANGKVTLRPQIRCANAVTKTVIASANYPFVFFAKNLGPAA